MRERLLSVVMLLMGILLVVGSTASTFATSIFPFDKYLGINASVAGVAFGAGIAVASFDPEANLSWIRIGIIYAILLVAYQVVFGLFVGFSTNWGPIVLGIAFAVALVALHPRGVELMPTSRVMAAGETRWRS
jgi:cytochrome c oxidase subunit IV